MLGQGRNGSRCRGERGRYGGVGRKRADGGWDTTGEEAGEAEELSSHDVYHTQHPAPSPDRGGFMYHMLK